MAKDKKSFIGYCDWERTFDFLSDEEAGKLIKHFFAYINDKDPILEDRLLQMAFEPIKLQLNRDLSKYEEVKRKRSEAGRQGGLKSGESRGKQSEPIDSDASHNEPNEANASSAKQNEANEAVTDTVIVTVNDTVTDTDILLEKETKGENQDFLQTHISEEDIFSTRNGFTYSEDLKAWEKGQLKPVISDSEEKEKSSAKKEKEKFFSKRDFKKKLIEHGVEEVHIDDWFKVRDKKRASYTETALDGLINECLKHSFPVKDAVRICAENSWQGFKYSWLDEKQKNNGQSNNQSSNARTSNVRNSNDKVSGTTEILGGARYTEFT
ncbi:hypothetical protein CMU85_18090 [Elizabethkingia anophelis]|nr:hypothetical protein [Elizabethkingia anophelis]